MHQSTAATLNNFAALYKSQGKYDDAESLYKRALVIREEMLGPMHPDTEASLNNLTALYKSQGKYDDAELLYKRVLAIIVARYHSPSVIISQKNCIFHHN